MMCLLKLGGSITDWQQQTLEQLLNWTDKAVKISRAEQEEYP